MKMNLTYFSFCFSWVLFTCSISFAQVTIAPTTLFLDSQQRFGTVLILNGSQQAQEISVDFLFGYPTSDSLGSTQMVYDDPARENQFSVADDIRGFPRRFTLNPGQRQVVRLTVMPGNRPDGMYWTRVRTTSNPQSPPIGQANDNAVTAQINFKFEQITSAFYKKGTVNTGLNIKDFKILIHDSTATARADVERTGNAPFLGSALLTLRDEQGNTVLKKHNSTTVYFDVVRTIDFSLSNLPKGNYKATLTFKSERPDIAIENLVQIKPISKTTNFTIR